MITIILKMMKKEDYTKEWINHRTYLRRDGQNVKYLLPESHLLEER